MPLMRKGFLKPSNTALLLLWVPLRSKFRELASDTHSPRRPDRIHAGRHVCGSGRLRESLSVFEAAR